MDRGGFIIDCDALDIGIGGVLSQIQHFQDEVDDVIPLSQKAEEAVRRMTMRAMAGQGNSGRSLDQQPWIGRYSHHEMARMQKEDLDLAPVYNW